MKNLFALFALIVMLFACNNAEQKGEKTKVERYTSEEMGWTIEIPEGFQSLSKNKVEANAEKGKAAISDVYGEQVTADGLIHLVNFQKNQFNQLNAAIEVFKEKDPVAYERNNEVVKKLIYDTYTKQKIKVDTLSGHELIGKYRFHTFAIKIYGPDGNLILNQLVYNQLIKGYDFSVNINYNNEADKKTLLSAFKNAKFEEN